MNYTVLIERDAKDALEELGIKSREQADDMSEEIEEYVLTQAESEVTYTRDAYNILLNTKNDDAYLELGDIDTSKGATATITTMAFWAYRQDLQDEISEMIAELPLNN